MIRQALKERAVYRWSWREGCAPDRLCSPYWCRSQIAIVVDGKLWDTYWGPDERPARPDLCSSLDPRQVDLTFLANLDDLRPEEPDALDRYEPEDLVNLRHPNGGRVYVRKGARESRRVQIAAWLLKRDELLAQADHFQRLIDQARSVP